VNNLKQDFLLKELPISRQALNSLFAHSPFCSFFVNTSAGVMEFQGAAIHGSSDIIGEEPAKGYFFSSRLWGKSFVGELSRLTGSLITLTDTVFDNLIQSKVDTVKFSRILTGWNNRPVKYLVVSSVSQTIIEIKKSLIQIAVLFISFFIVILLVIAVFISYWVNLPLGLMSLALKKGDVTPLTKIKKQGTEFSDLSEMMDSFFTQRKEIIREVSERRQVQDALTKVNQCFVSFVADPDKNIQLITETAGKILRASCMLYNRSRDSKLVTEAGWNVPSDFSRSDLGQGHICFDVIKNQSNQLIVLEDLQHSSYAQTDPNVKKYNLQSYISCPVRVAGRTVASFCAVFTSSVKVDQYHLNLLQVLGKAASIEEDRKITGEVFKEQALKLDSALKEALKSREVLLSMLEDNHLNKEKLEQSVQELALAYSKLKESQQEVIQSAKFGAIGQLASSVAHEVRNPLAIIMQSIEYLRNKVAAEHREIIEVATNNIKRANTIVGTLLDFSKAKQLSIEPQDINAILNDSLVLTRYSNLKDKVKIVKELASDLPKVLVDRQKMEQVFVNIFLNAIQAMPKEGSIFVRSYLSEFNNLPEKIRKAINDQALEIKQVVIVEVQDEGVGISEENLKNIFRPFFTTKGAMMGIGLGLSVVKDIITMHNGSIEIESQENRGTKVIVTLRVA